MIKLNPKRIAWFFGILTILALVGFQILALHEKKLGELEGKAYQYMQEGRNDKAILEFTKLINNQRNFYKERGACYYAKGLLEEGLVDLNKAIEKNGQDGYVYNTRGIIYQAKENFEKAINDFNKAANFHFLAGDTTLLRNYGFASFEELENKLNSAYHNKKEYTDLQGKEIRKKQRDLWEQQFRGRKIYWALRVEDIMDELLWIRIPALASDVKVNVFLNYNQKKKALQLQKGQRVKVFGILDDFDGLTAKYSIREAKITNVLATEDLWGEKQDWIANLMEKGQKSLSRRKEGSNEELKQEITLCDQNGICENLIDILEHELKQKTVSYRNQIVTCLINVIKKAKTRGISLFKVALNGTTKTYDIEGQSSLPGSEMINIHEFSKDLKEMPEFEYVEIQSIQRDTSKRGAVLFSITATTSENFSEMGEIDLRKLSF